MCEKPPCPPLPPEPCPQICPPPCPPTGSINKPTMRGLHWAQTTRIIAQACALSVAAGMTYYFFVGRVRIAAYADYHAKVDMEEWADEMARKGLFQAVPKESLRGNAEKE